jgi:hypothetical protein
VNLCPFYFYKVIGKQTVFLQFQDFNFLNFHHTVFSSELKSNLENILTKTAVLRITLNIDGTPLTSRSHTYPSHSQTSRLLISSLSLGVPGSHATVYVSGVDLSTSAFSLSSHRHSYISLLFSSRFIVS